MPDDSRLLDLIVRWEEMREAGQSLSAEQLCQDCPELLPALQQRLETLRAVDAALGPGDGSQYTVILGSGDTTKTQKPGAEGRSPADQADGGAISGIPGYEVLRELGRGGMGVVYLARQSGLERLVALKMLLAGQHASPSQRVRFEAEVKAIGRLQHPNLVQVFEVGEHEGRAYFSMEYLEGGNLEDKIASRPQPPRHAAELVEVLARAIHAAHQHGVIHRDLKPANVLLTSTGVPKISDFGLAKRMDASWGPTLTQHILGTPSYMAPEQATGQSRKVAPGTDVYALGAILYQLLTGRPPFLGEFGMNILRQVAEEEPVPPRRLQTTVPADLETICLKCLQKHPAQRYASAAALADDLACFLAHKPILARPVSLFRRLAKWARRRPAAAGLIAVTGLALVVALVAGWWFTQRLATELHKTDQARRDLEQALVRQVAEGLDSDLRQLEGVPQAMAALLAVQTKWNEEYLKDWTRALVKKDKRIFGLCLAFEPWQFEGARAYENYCLYVHEIDGGVNLRTKQLLPPSYPAPFYRDREWYTDAKSARRAAWSEPYKGQGADNTPMVTYSVPLFREGKFSGVVAADLSIEYFRGFHNHLQNLYLGPDSHSFVISPQGTFIYHPNLRYEFPSATSSLDRIQAAPDFLALARRMRQEETGRGQATDFNTGRPATFLFTPIPSTGWQFVVVHADPAPAEGLKEE